MSQFNKYEFLRNLNEELTNQIENGNIDNEDQIQEYIDSELDNACIYYRTCFEIAMELNLTDFTEFELGTANNISQLAYFGLYELVNNELDRSELIELIEQKQAENEQ